MHEEAVQKWAAFLQEAWWARADDIRPYTSTKKPILNPSQRARIADYTARADVGADIIRPLGFNLSQKVVRVKNLYWDSPFLT